MTDFNVPTTIETLLVRFIASQARQWNAMGESLARIESRVANVEAELLQVIIEQRRAQQPEPAVQEPQEPNPKSDSLAIIESRVANVEAEMRQVIEQLTSVEEPPEPTIQESEAELLAAFEENVANQISTATLGMPLVNYSESNIPSSNVSQAGTDIEEQEEEINPIYRPMTIFEDTCKLYKFERDTGFSNFDTAGRYQIQIVTLDRNGNTAYVLLRHPEQEEQKFLIAQRDKATPRQDRGLCCVLTCDDTAKTFLVIFTSVTVARQFIEVYNRVAKA
ncbi:hypothetical protein L596_009197 [Steinernema carpocapsae]|uniref:Uncharacterized protein n=1 Tax=Steinernema carpocapsae TaxID=34508 RepID=A0A4U5PEP8_STECR|nr:hypothetical protein L596_009197 [Steinernema carpocapsae]